MSAKNKRDYKQSKKYKDKQFKKAKKHFNSGSKNVRFKKRLLQEQQENNYLARKED